MVTGGNSSTGLVTLGGPAPAGGVVVSLTSTHPAVASVPATVTVPAGSKSANFPIATFVRSVDIDVLIQASSGGATWGANLYVRPPGLPALTSIAIAPASVPGGSQSGGTLTFSAPIRQGVWPAIPDGVVRFTSSDPEVASAMPGSELVPAGSTTHSFGIFSRGGPVARNVTISASYDNVTLSGVLTVGAVTGITVSSLTSNITNLSGGQGGIASVQLSAPAPATLLLAISTNHPELFSSLPDTIVVPAGSTSSSFAFVTNKSAAATTQVTLTAAYGASASSVALSVGPPTSTLPPVIGVSLSPATVGGGTSSAGVVTLGSPAPAGGAVVQLFSSNTNAATVPATTTVPAGASSANFTITTRALSGDTQVTISALLQLSASTALTVKAPAAPPPVPAAPTLLSPADGTTLAQPITLDWSDVTGAVSYNIQIDDGSQFPAPLIVDQTVTVSQFTAPALVAKRYFWRVRGINSAGVFGPFSAVRRFTAQAPPAVAALSTLALNPTSVVGGNASQGTVTLTSAAPTGGAVVTLSSSNTGVATVPASVTVAAGATSATFPVNTPAVTASSSSTISGSFGGATRSAALTVTPAPPAPPAPAPGQAATLTVTATGRSGERVTSTPAGISVAVGSTGSASFTTGTSITLAVSNGRDAIWSGACSSGGNKAKTCTFTLTAAASVTANVQ